MEVILNYLNIPSTPIIFNSKRIHGIFKILERKFSATIEEKLKSTFQYLNIPNIGIISGQIIKNKIKFYRKIYNNYSSNCEKLRVSRNLLRNVE